MRARWMLLAFLAVGLPLAGTADEEGAEHVAAYCTVCHGDDLIHQQRLTEEQWRATIEKMVAWGAQAKQADLQDKLVSYLAANFGPDAGPFSPARVEAQTARAAVEPLPDDPFGGGDASRGKQLYSQDCIACHSPTAVGLIGLNLVDRYLLDRAHDFATIVREGRPPWMPGRPMDDAGVADLLAYLRTLPR